MKSLRERDGGNGFADGEMCLCTVYSSFPSTPESQVSPSPAPNEAVIHQCLKIRLLLLLSIPRGGDLSRISSPSASRFESWLAWSERGVSLTDDTPQEPSDAYATVMENVSTESQSGMTTSIFH